MVDRIDPDATGAWDITTLSGARYRLRIPPDGRATVVRVPTTRPRPYWPRSVQLRRDHEPIEVVTWGSLDQLLGPLPGIIVGQCMLLVLEPLSTTGTATVRLTTPVLNIDPVSGTGGAVARSRTGKQ